MDTPYLETLLLQKETDKDILYNTINHTTVTRETILFERGFFICLVINGTSSISNAERCYIIQKNDIIILTPSMSNKLYSRSKDFVMRCIYIHPDYFDSLPDGLVMYHQLSRFKGRCNVPIFHTQQDIFEYILQTGNLFTEQLNYFRFCENGIKQHLCSLLLLQLTDILCQNKKDIALDIKRSDHIFRNFKKYSVVYYKEHHDIQFYANLLNISTTYLSRIVKNITGRTVRSHLSELICHEAKRLLESTDMDIKEIANTLGFSDQSVFGKFFVKATGFSPLKYRLGKERHNKENVQL